MLLKLKRKNKIFFLLFLSSISFSMHKPMPPRYGSHTILMRSSIIPAAKSTFYGIDLHKMQTASSAHERIECLRQLFSVLLQQELKYIPHPSAQNEDNYDYRFEEITDEQRAQALELFSKN